MVECDIIIVRVGLSKGLDSAGLSLTTYLLRQSQTTCLLMNSLFPTSEVVT